MFPIEWRLAADLCQKMLGAERDSSAAPAPTGRDGSRRTPRGLRRQVGAVFIALGERLQGTARPAESRPSLPDLRRGGERAICPPSHP